ncbi:MAG: EF-hand domain-containing protein [Candidatus Riflebacteria bacterium]|nr:EF-hand domain-containing protein [Candidatus Riflebacteria bacterium]
MRRIISGFFMIALAAALLIPAATRATDDAPAGLKVTDITALIREFQAVDTNHDGKLTHDELGQRFHWQLPAEMPRDASAHAAAGQLGFTRTQLFSLLAEFRGVDANGDKVLSHVEIMGFFRPDLELTGGQGAPAAACPVADACSVAKTCQKAPTCKGAVRCDGDPDVVCHKAPTCKGAVHVQPQTTPANEELP